MSREKRLMKNYLKFGLLIAAVLGTLAWLAVGGISETKTYYKTVAELKQLGESSAREAAARGRRYRSQFHYARGRQRVVHAGAG